MSVYDALATYLGELPPSSVHFPMTFAEIERVLGRPLPHSAYQWRAWWSNNASNSAMTAAWLAAGWESSAVDMEGRKLVFRRRWRPGGGSGPSGRTHTRPAGDASLIVSGLTDDTMASLKARARLAGSTPSEAAARILNERAALSISERLAIADRLREEGPVLNHLDIPAMVREDRGRV